ncbi:MAG: gluconate 2-dehydrogenase subunit 3 family protein [Flavobacteriaceae bacterium]
MNRRTALKNLGLSLGAVTVAPALGNLLQSCESGPQWTPQFFSQEQARLLELMVDVILPETDIPGAKSLGLASKIDLMIHMLTEEEQKPLLTQLANQFTTLLQKDHDNISLTAVGTEQLAAQLQKYLRATEEQMQTWWEEINADEDATMALSDEAASFLYANQIRGLAVNAFKQNEYIGENVMAYAPIPGQQKGCVDLNETTGGMAWSL